MHAKEFCGKAFLSSTDLEEGQDYKLIISSADREEIFDPGTRKNKPVGILSFSNHPLRMICNTGNTMSIISLHGNETKAWVGKWIHAYRTTTKVAGKVVPCLRVRDRAFYDSKK